MWVEIPISSHLIHIAFPYNHIGADPPKVIFLLLLGAAVLIFLTSSFLVRRLTQPLEKLSQAAVQMGQGTQVAPLQETGAQELVLLTRSFNQMNQKFSNYWTIVILFWQGYPVIYVLLFQEYI
ncbi:MAG: HAMP domain-containing protein [Thiohalomonas sp.]|nr:HAMP domain-containing protein [Thiohalomonas sp.]